MARRRRFYRDPVGPGRRWRCSGRSPRPSWRFTLAFRCRLVLVVLPTVIMFQLEKGQTFRTLPVSNRLRRWMWAAAIYTYGVVYSGAYVRHTNSHMACLDWPLCNGALIPNSRAP